MEQHCGNTKLVLFLSDKCDDRDAEGRPECRRKLLQKLGSEDRRVRR